MGSTIYTLMPDFGGAYCWEGNAETELGACNADDAGWYGDIPISSGLHQECVRWQVAFESASWWHTETVLIMDWLAYHREGLRLASLLKTEVGDKARVFYEKPWEDPNHNLDTRYEVLESGECRYIEIDRCHRQGQATTVRKIVSGAQTGVDRAALDVAIEHFIPHGGWVPKGRPASDGTIPLIYQMLETDSVGYRQRTKRNVQDSDATLIFNTGDLSGGTLLTQRFASSMDKPSTVIQLDQRSVDEAVTEVRDWIKAAAPVCINVAGPGEEKRPGIYAITKAVLTKVFAD